MLDEISSDPRYLPTRNFQIPISKDKKKVRREEKFWAKFRNIREITSPRDDKGSTRRFNRIQNASVHHARRKKVRYSAWKQRIEKYPRARRNIPWFVSRPGLDSSPEGWYRGENLPSSLLDLRRFMENSRPLVSPTVRKQSAYDASIVELSMEIPSKLLSNFVHATLSPPLPPLASIYAYAPIRWWRYRFRRGVIDHLFTAG